MVRVGSESLNEACRGRRRRAIASSGSPRSARDEAVTLHAANRLAAAIVACFSRRTARLRLRARLWHRRSLYARHLARPQPVLFRPSAAPPVDRAFRGARFRRGGRRTASFRRAVRRDGLAPVSADVGAVRSASRARRLVRRSTSRPSSSLPPGPGSCRTGRFCSASRWRRLRLRGSFSIPAGARAASGGSGSSSGLASAWLACRNTSGRSRSLGLLAFLVISPTERRWFRHPAPYVAATLAVLIILPVFVWNAQHGWASFAFQGSRGVASGGLKPLQVLRVALGQIAFLSPWLFVPLFAGLVSGMRHWRDARRLFLLCLSLPPIVLFTVAPLWIERGQPHWSMAGWFFVFPLMGAWAEDIGVPVRNLRRYAALSIALLAALSAGVVVEARTGWLWRALPAGTTDPTLGSPRLERTSPKLRFFSPRRAFVVSTRWKEAGKIALALGPGVPIFVVSDDPRGWTFMKGGAGLVGRDGVLIVRPRDLRRCAGRPGASVRVPWRSGAVSRSSATAPRDRVGAGSGERLHAAVARPYPVRLQ